jgi:hypothetical protein
MSKHLPFIWLPLGFLLVGFAFLNPVRCTANENALTSSFLEPIKAARPQTLWFWMNGNVTREGITLDLEAMKDAGLGGAVIFDGGDYFPEGPAQYLNPLWQDLMEHAVEEADRLGLTIAMHNAPGWSSTGGPWITPEMSMKQLVWSEVTVQGRMSSVKLPQPQTNLGFYRDACVIAFPAQPGETVAFRDRIRRAGTDYGKVVTAALLTDGLLDTSVPLKKGGFVEIELNDVFSIHGITLNSSIEGKFPRYLLQVSQDGINFSEVAEVASVGTHSIRVPASVNFPEVKGRFFRLIPRGDADLAEVELLGYPRVFDWVRKSNLSYNLGYQVNIPEPGETIPGIDPHTVINLTDNLNSDGTLNWTAPDGSWTVIRFGYTTTGKHNVTASVSGDGLECDKFDSKAVDFHFNKVIGTILKNAGDLAGKSFNAITIDSYEAGMQNWSEDFPGEFLRRSGYDITPYLPALTGRIVGNTAVSERFFYDFQRAQAALMTDAYYKHMKELANGSGLGLYVEGYGQGVFDELEVSGSSDYPMSEFWTRTPWTPNRTMKMVSSAAHVYGKPVVAAESFTGEEHTTRWLTYPYALKGLGDIMYSWGLNQMIFHRFAHQPHATAFPGMAMGLWGFQFERTNTWFKDSPSWIEYLTRCQSVLRKGSYVADILYFVGERPPDVAQWALPAIPNGYTYDLVNADVILNRLEAKDGKMVLPEGNSYRILVLPPILECMTPELMKKLESFANNGVLIVGSKPKHSLSLRGFPKSENDVQSIADRIWKKKNVFASANLEEVLKSHSVAPDFEYEGKEIDASLSWCHRQDGETDLYFVANRQRRVDETVCSFRVSGKRPELWYPETGEIRQAVVYEDLGDRIRIPLRLDPVESVFVVFREPSDKVAPKQVLRDGEVVISTEKPSDLQKPIQPTDSFTMAVWVKPDIEQRLFPQESTEGFLDETGKFYAIPAAKGDRLFGEGHACVGLAVGRNGVFVVERSSENAPAVLAAPMPISGWTHVAIVYNQGNPKLYVDGQFVKEGLKSGRTVHPGVGSPLPDPESIFHFTGLDNMAKAAGTTPPPSNGRVFFFEGNMTAPELFEEAMSETQISELFDDGIPLPSAPPVIELCGTDAQEPAALIWESGIYGLGDRAPVEASVEKPFQLDGPWTVEFPPGKGAPESIRMDKLESLHLHQDTGVKYFGGTAAYTHTLEVEDQELEDGKHIVLDLGRVEVIARVFVNGKQAGLLWKEPYRVDITDYVKPGDNALSIEVTTLLVNRLIGDEQLPPELQFGYVAGGGTDAYSLNSATGSGIRKFPEWYLKGDPKPEGGRITFSTWGFYNKDEPLVASGLLGPVRVYYPVSAKFTTK